MQTNLYVWNIFRFDFEPYVVRFLSRVEEASNESNCSSPLSLGFTLIEKLSGLGDAMKINTWLLVSPPAERQPTIKCMAGWSVVLPLDKSCYIIIILLYFLSRFGANR